MTDRPSSHRARSWTPAATRRTALGIVALAWVIGQPGPGVAEPVDPSLVKRVETLSRSTRWHRLPSIPLKFDAFHPQGMVKIGADFFISSVEVRRTPAKLKVPEGGHDYDTGAGVGHLFKVGPDGALLGDTIVGEGSIYHPGGIDYDGRSIWVPVSEYRPHSRTIIYTVTPSTMAARKVMLVADHIGAVVHDTAGRRVVALTWGSRRFYAWPAPRADRVERVSTTRSVANRSSYIDYQDCHYVGGRRMLCDGVAEYAVTPDRPAFQLGGVELIDLSRDRPVWQAPIALWAPSGRAMTQNPFWVEATRRGMRAYLIPDDGRSTMFVEETGTP